MLLRSTTGKNTVDRKISVNLALSSKGCQKFWDTALIQDAAMRNHDRGRRLMPQVSVG